MFKIMTLGQNIKKYRIEAKLTQTDLANKLDIIQSNIHRWEADKIMPSLETLKKLATILNVSIDNLIFTSKEIKKFKLANKDLFEKLKDLETLSEADRITIINMIETLKIKSNRN